MAISLKEVTRHAKDTDGVYDALMSVTEDKLQSLFRTGSFSSEAKAEITVQLMREAMQQAIQYSLQKPASDKNLELIDAQIAVANQQTQNLVKEGAGIDAQTANVQKETELTEKRILTADKEIEVMQSGIDYQTNQGALITAQTDVAYKEAIRVDKQNDRIDKEILLLDEKIETEKANYTGNPSGLIGKKMSLYDAQIQAFTTDNEIKNKRIAVDVWSTMFTMGTDLYPPNDIYPYADPNAT